MYGCADPPPGYPIEATAEATLMGCMLPLKFTEGHLGSMTWHRITAPINLIIIRIALSHPARNSEQAEA